MQSVNVAKDALRSKSPTVTDFPIAEFKEASVIVTVTEQSRKKSETIESPINLELRKDLLLECTTSNEFSGEESKLYKSESAVSEELERAYLDSRQPPSYVTLTPCHLPTVIQHQDEYTDVGVSSNLTLMPNMLNFNPPWVSCHEDSSLLTLAPPQSYAPSPCYYPTVLADGTTLEYSQQTLTMTEDSYKQSTALSNALYQFDANNRRIWVPENCATRSSFAMTESSANNSRSPTNALQITSLHDGDVFMAAEFENEELLQQHVVNIERFPNRSWRGPSTSRAQYEKGS